jgi:RNA polymerase-binding transcription factor DksA
MRTHDVRARTLTTELVNVTARLRRLDTPTADRIAGSEPVDAAQMVEQHERAGLTAGRLATRARRLRAALERLAKGHYGRCDECGARIAAARLRAMPDADTCVPCQMLRERLRAAR